ncbi:hypothetical protein OY671_000281 [Metschnikowia pulcherrima]|nr:hypothetical protein OY671_000281 [Metschnikowia pulcherrima]
MQQADFSTNAKQINELYTKIVRGNSQTAYGIFTVDKSNVLDASASGSGDLNEFVEEFNDGTVQFGLARVIVPGSQVHKIILLGWCPDNAPAKLRLTFAPMFAEISRLFAGYHVQITARDFDDLDVEEMLARVGSAAGARYTFGEPSGKTTMQGSPFSVKPSALSSNSKPNEVKSTPNRLIKSGANEIQPDTAPTANLNERSAISRSASDDGWGEEKPIEERDLDTRPLEEVPSAYIPTKVNIEELRKQKSDSISSPSVGQKLSDKRSPGVPDATSFSMDKRSPISKSKTSTSVLARYQAASASSPSSVKPTFGSKPSFGSVPSFSAPPGKKESLGGLFRNHANENGLSPAQAWAQRKGKYVVDKENITGAEVSISKLSVGEEQKDHMLDSRDSLQQKELKGLQRPTTATVVPGLSSDLREEALPAETTGEEKEDPSVTPVESSRSSSPRAEDFDTTVKDHDEKEGLKSHNSKKAVASYAYTKDEENELSFVEGDVITNIDFVDEEWWSGMNERTAEVGLFPGSYVTLTNSSSESQDEEMASPTFESVEVQQDSELQGKSAIAEYDYDKEEDNEIGFKEGDLIVDIEFVDEDWWSGKHYLTGEVGVFPGNFVALQ